MLTEGLETSDYRLFEGLSLFTSPFFSSSSSGITLMCYFGMASLRLAKPLLRTDY